jgi:hypothetical protein
MIGTITSASDPGSDPALRFRQHRHDHNGHGGDDEAGNATLRDFVADQRGAGLVGDVQRQGNETPAHDPQSGPLDLFTAGMVKIVV